MKGKFLSATGIGFIKEFDDNGFVDSLYRK